MKTSLSSLDIMSLVEELRPSIVGSRVNNIYNVGKKVVILRFRKSSEVNFEFVIELGKRFHATKFVRAKPSAPSNKISMVRKHIRGLPVDNFYQVGLDRIIVFEIAFKDGYYKLVVELFGEGNFILVSPENKILVAHNYRKMRDRDIHPGRDFKLPPIPDLDVLKIDSATITERLESEDGKLVNLLNRLLGLGPQYSKNILNKCNLTNVTVSDLSKDEKTCLTEEILSLKQTILSKDFQTHTYLDEGDVIDITPIPLLRYDDLDLKISGSFNDAIDEFFSTNEEEPDFTEDKAEVSGKLSKYEKILRDQISHKAKLEKQEQVEKKKGDLLYANFAAIDELLSTLKQARQSNISWEEITAKLALGKEKGIESAKILEKIEPKNKKLWISVHDSENDTNQIIELDFTLSVTDSANTFYEKAKKARRKIPGADKAIARTKKQLETAQEQEEELVTEVSSKKMVEKRSKKWYEKFHWFICDGFVVIGGTDAKTNERILKTYLDDNDLFFHADIHGAPYVIVKDGQDKIKNHCKEQIAIFALSYSSLWKAGKYVGDVYYVLPEQVSLTAPSGQYLSKGSVMIYGEKNYLKNVVIEHSVGLLIFENYAQIIGGPTDTIAEKTDILVDIKPGDLSKGIITKQIKQKFLELCPEDDKYKLEAIDINKIMKFVPGNSDFAR